MQVHIRHNPSFAVARVLLAPTEPVHILSGAMMAHSPGMSIDARAEGGLLSGLSREIFAGASTFTTTMTAPPQGGWVDLTSVLPGDVLSLPISPDRAFFLTRGAWLGNSHGVVTDTHWGGIANLLGGEGGFGLRAWGQGEVLLSVYGALDVCDLTPGEQVVIDSGHVVAYDLGMRFQLRKASASGLWNSLKSGEGYVFDFLGPGRVYLQSRNPAAFDAYVREQVPSE